METNQQARISTNTEIAGELLNLDGKKVVDVGCGEGRFTRFLAQSAAQTSGLDINQVSLDRARAKAREESIDVDWRQGRAEEMPFADESLDLVVFSNSLHHVAMEHMVAALQQAARVLKPGGDLYIMEPVAAGNYFEATRLVNDESIVRNKATAAIHEVSAKDFEPVTEVSYHARRSYDSYEEYATEQSERSDKRKRLFAEKNDEIRARFLAAAQHEDGKLTFDQIFRVNLLRKHR
jgi:ubiquinone/menaquinone biosynthesis C-methylase UbiE